MGAKQESELVSVDSEKAYYLQRTQVAEDLKQELASWARRRFTIITVVLAVIGFFGLNNYIENTVKTHPQLVSFL